MTYPAKPCFYEKPPQPYFLKREVIQCINIDDGDVIHPQTLTTNSGEVWVFETRFDDNREREDYFLIQYLEKTVPNNDYNDELTIYNRKLTEYNELMVEYNKQLELYNKQLELYTKELNDKMRNDQYQTYLKLKAQFEK